MLRGERFVDLYAVVRQGMRISKESYSIKKMEAFYWKSERNKNEDVADALASVVAYEKWLVERDPDTLDQIEAYNRDDVRSTQDLHTWLESRRDELEASHGPLLRPHEVPPEPDKPLSDQEVAELDLADRLNDAGHTLLADLVQWYRREARPAWWEFFRLDDLPIEDLEDDGSALGPLSAPEYVREQKRSQVWRYTFPPQETRVRQGQKAHDFKTHDIAGTVVALDAAGGFIELKLTGEPKESRGFGPSGPMPTGPLQRSVSATAEDLLQGKRGLAADLIDRVVPENLQLQEGESAREAVVRIGRAMSGGVLAVQGPPGSGKSTVAAELIRALLDDGKKVGVTASSHAVIGELLKKVGRPAVQRCKVEEFCNAPGVTQSTSNGEASDSLNSGEVALVGATAWPWASPDLVGSVDVLVIDEAGQFSLVNGVAAAPAAKAMVLLGDPQQLSQPTQAQHPEGAGVSALEHLLEGNETILANRGVFLDKSWRMHPDVTVFISDLAYEGRLESGPDLERQTVLPGGLLSGSGLRLVTVEHSGNAARSPEEASVVAELWQSLVGQRYVDSDNIEGELTAADVLIVAPFNRQVAEIRDRLPDARVGTVDKFQGQEAPVVIYSMTSSSVDDAPRGVGFLFDLHRMNVAVSRAQAMAVIVCSPALLDAPVSTPEQLRQVNALCRYAELAT